MNFSIVLALACVALTNQLVGAKYVNRHEWEMYKRQHGKAYETPEEDAQRFGRFMMAKEEIARHNNKEAAFKLGLSQLSDWTEEELNKLTGLRFDSLERANLMETNEDDQADFLSAILNDERPLPEEVDWRRVPNRVAPVKNQKRCGSCWAFSTTGALEGQQVARNFTKELVPLSEQDLVDCSIDNMGCEGGFPADAMRNIATMGGIESERDYEYQGVEGEKCKFDQRKSVMTVKGARVLPANNEEALKKVVARFGPVSVGIAASKPLYHYKSGIYTGADCPAQLNHAVLVVGYGSDPKLGDFWIVDKLTLPAGPISMPTTETQKNSWSDKWGEQGYFRIHRGSLTCGIGSNSMIPTF